MKARFGQMTNKFLDATLLRRQFLGELRRDSNNWLRFHGRSSTIHSDRFLVERLQLINLGILSESFHYGAGAFPICLNKPCELVISCMAFANPT